MEAPTQSSPAPEAARTRAHAGALRLRLSPQACLLLALVVLGLSTYEAVRQRLHPDVYRQTYVLSREWWAYPFEWNSPARLPVIGRDLRDVYAVPNTTTVYAVGERGTVLVSNDDGETWQTPATITPTPTPSPTATATPTPAPTASPNSGATQSYFSLPDLISTASAAELHTAAPQNSNSAGGLVPPTAQKHARRSPQPVQSTAGGNRNAQRRVPARANSNTSSEGAIITGTRPAPPPFQKSQGRSRMRFDHTAEAIEDGATGPSVEGKTLSAACFRNELEGLVVTDAGECLKTTDGGVSWSGCEEGGFVDNSGDESTRLSGGAVPGIGWIAYNRSGLHGILRVRLPEKTPDSEALVERVADYQWLPDSIAEDVFFVDENVGWGITGTDGLFHTSDGGRTWEPWFSDLPLSSGLHSFFFLDANRGWAVGTAGDIVVTTDGGHTWKLRAGGTAVTLRSVSFRPDGLHGWAVGDAGAILHTEDGGATWMHQTREQRRRADGQLENAEGVYYFRLLPPWYYLSWVVVAFLLLPVRRTAVVDLGEEPEPSVADVLVSDRPLEEGDADTIDFRPIALGLSRFLRNENTKPPLTIAITGEWGTGKSSLMNLLRADLRRYDFRPVWFNAWHHQKEEHLLASLLQNVRLQAVPPFWRPEGIVFRLRLLRIRGARHWGPVLLLFGCAAVVVFYELIRNSTGAVNTYPEEFFKEIAALFYGDHTPPVGDFTKYYLLRLPLLVSLLTVAGTLWRGATAFGVNPASLMASMSRGVRVRDLDAQTSFRQRFASEFRDVTEALGARSMIIFIDDLDRCRPENVVETLEAVNFLVSSGGCFVVIGMARERVEPCVGLSFKDVAAEMLDEDEMALARLGPEDEGARVSPQTGQDAQKLSEPELKRLQEEKGRLKRLEYARQYLDKLINIEVPVPAPSRAQSCDILMANARQDEARAAGKPRPVWQRMLPSGAEALVSDYGRLLAWCAGLVVLISLCYALASLLARPLPVADATTAPATANATPTPRPTATPAPTVMPSTGGAARPVQSPQPTSSPTPTLTPTPANANTPELTPGKRSVLLAALPVLVVVLVVAWVVAWVLTRRPGLVVKDSPKFVEALRVWHPLVYARSTTPRSAKRFMNRVRYLAMRQRRQSDSPPAWRRLLRRFFPTAKSDVATPSEAQDNGAAPIPDELLVALAAIQHLKPRWLRHDIVVASSPNIRGADMELLEVISLNEADVGTSEWKLLKATKHEHEQRFGEWDGARVAAARAEFLRISEGVQVN